MSTEFFWVAILGITIIATLDCKICHQRLMSGLFGLMLATIGEHPTSAMERFVFTDHLEGGFILLLDLLACLQCLKFGTF